MAAESTNRDTKSLILKLYRAERYFSHIDKSIPWFMTLRDSFRSLHSETKPKFAWLSIEYRLMQIARRDERARQSPHTIGNRIFAVRDIWIYETQAVSARAPKEAESVLVVRIQPRHREFAVDIAHRPYCLCAAGRCCESVTNQQVWRSKAKLPKIKHEQKKLQSRNANTL